MRDQCRHGHQIRVPGDLRSNGHCRACATRGEQKYRRTLIDARRRLAAIEAALA
jgi:hypothetical protein